MNEIRAWVNLKTHRIKVMIRRFKRFKDISGFFAYTDSEGEYHRGKTLWDWLELLIIPLVLAVGVLYFNSMQSVREQEILADNQQEEVLQSYLDDMGSLLLDTNLAWVYDGTDESLDTPLVDVAQTKTVTALRRLDKERRDIVLQFLRDSGLGDFILIGASMPGADLRSNELYSLYLSSATLYDADLREADLSEADLSGANLFEANLRGAYLLDADLSGASLSRTDLSGAILVGADLSEADLSDTDLSEANLFEANLRGASFWGEVDLRWATLYDADLRDVDLSRAFLDGADLRKAMYNENTIWPDSWDKERLDKAGALLVE